MFKIKLIISLCAMCSVIRILKILAIVLVLNDGNLCSGSCIKMEGNDHVKCLLFLHQ